MAIHIDGAKVEISGVGGVDEASTLRRVLLMRDGDVQVSLAGLTVLTGPLLQVMAVGKVAVITWPADPHLRRWLEAFVLCSVTRSAA